jgi:hypothetical protein
MALPAADMRIETGPSAFLAKRCHLDAALERGSKRSRHFGAQDHELARVGAQDGWDRARAAQVTSPICGEEAAFFVVAASVIVPVKIFTFSSSRSFHSFIKQRTNDVICGRSSSVLV